MNNKQILFSVFILMVLAQLFVPAKMILDREAVLKDGKAFKFKTAPIDPNDPFRGKYIVLNFSERTFKVQNEEDWARGDKVFVSLITDNDGFAKIQAVSKEAPADGTDFVEAEVNFVSYDNTNEINILYPFDRFYMEESKAFDAEQIYMETRADTSQVAWALVKVKDGAAVLEDVLLDGVPVKEVVEKENQ